MGESPMIPAEVVEQLRRFHDTIIAMEDTFQPLLVQKPEDRLKLPLLEQARCHLLSVFAVNSFYWMLMRMKGLNPKENESLATELNRTKEYMARLKQMDDKVFAPRLNPAVAARFVRNALWEPKEELEQPGERSSTESEDSEVERGSEFGSSSVNCEVKAGVSPKRTFSARSANDVEAKKRKVEFSSGSADV